MEWKYKSPVERSTGYEDVMDYLASFKKDDFKKASPERQEEIIAEICNIYRERGIFPITYFNKEGIRKEIQRCIDYKAEISDGYLCTDPGVGASLCNFMFPNMYSAYNYGSKGKECKTALDRFYNDECLKKAIKFAMTCDNKGCVPKNVMSGIRMTDIMPSNFRPMNAKALYEKYCPVGGTIYDFSCGYGGRLLAALSSKNSFRYVGCEPNSETYDNLNALGSCIEEYIRCEGRFKILKIGSEDFKANPEIFDFAFSSPPYFNLEVYSDEPTQCYNRYPNIYDWLERYAYKTIENIYYMLKRGCYYAVNIEDFKIDGRKINYIDIWKKYSEDVGFTFVEKISMQVATRTTLKKYKKDIKKEGIYIYKKE